MLQCLCPTMRVLDARFDAHKSSPSCILFLLWDNTPALRNSDPQQHPSSSLAPDKACAQAGSPPRANEAAPHQFRRLREKLRRLATRGEPHAWSRPQFREALNRVHGQAEEDHPHSSGWLQSRLILPRRSLPWSLRPGIEGRRRRRLMVTISF